MKLVLREPESDELVEELLRWNVHTTSVVGDIETRRIAERGGADATAALGRVSLVELDDRVRELAVDVSPALRALDAIHLATALSLGNALGGFCCYDRRLAAGAEAAGLNVLAPA